MFCRYLLLKTMVPPLYLRLEGVETFSYMSVSKSFKSKSRRSSFEHPETLCQAPPFVLHNRHYTYSHILNFYSSKRKILYSNFVLKWPLLLNSVLNVNLHQTPQGSPSNRQTNLFPETPSSSKQLFTRTLSVLPKSILEASPPSFQPYLRLIRFDKPIGMY